MQISFNHNNNPLVLSLLLKRGDELDLYTFFGWLDDNNIRYTEKWPCPPYTKILTIADKKDMILIKLRWHGVN